MINCEVSDHAARPKLRFVPDDSLRSASDQYVFIRGLGKRTETIQIANYVPYEKVQNRWDYLSQQHRTPAQWEKFFNTVKGIIPDDIPGSPLDGDTIDAVVRHSQLDAAGEVDVPFASPGLKRKLKANEESLDQLAADIRNEEFEPTLDSAHNATVISELKQEVKKSSKKLKAVQSTMEGIDFDVVALANFLGKNNTGDVLPPLQDQVSGLEKRLLVVEDSSLDPVHVDWVKSTKSKFGDNFEKFVVSLTTSLTKKLNESVTPISRWLLSQTNLPATQNVAPNYGDKLQHRIDALDSKISYLESTSVGNQSSSSSFGAQFGQGSFHQAHPMTGVGAGGFHYVSPAATPTRANPSNSFGNSNGGIAFNGFHSPPHAGFTNGGHANPGAAAPSVASISQQQYQEIMDHFEASRKRQAELESTVRKLRDEKADEAVSINSHAFPTFSHFREWWDAEVNSGEDLPVDIHAFFPDVVSLMVKTATETDVSLIDDLSLEHKASQTNRRTAFAAIHAKSFSVVLPPQLGASISTKNSSESKSSSVDARRIPKMPKRKNFEGDSRLTAPKDLILRQVCNKRDVLRDKAGSFVPRELGSIAKLLLNDSYDFLKSLFEFMTCEVEEMNKERGSETEDANWIFVSHVVREIFNELHKVRQYGVAESGARQVWCTFQAWKLQTRIQDNKFLRDPIVEAVFTQYIRDSVVNKAVYEKEKSRSDTLVQGLKTEIANLRSQVQSINSKRKGGGKQEKKEGE